MTTKKTSTNKGRGPTLAEAVLNLFDLAETDAISGDESDYIGLMISEHLNDTQALGRYERRAFKDAIRHAEEWETPTDNYAELCEVARRVAAGEKVADVLRDRIAEDKANRAAFDVCSNDGGTLAEIIAAAFPDDRPVSARLSRREGDEEPEHESP